MRTKIEIGFYLAVAIVLVLTLRAEQRDKESLRGSRGYVSLPHGTVSFCKNGAPITLELPDHAEMRNFYVDCWEASRYIAEYNLDREL